ncbi:uracil-DNA glycosylase family protein [uncultured Sulfitobacter sp.]|uniref:uracil-DNA glycosylase family protein n=1 Tax=uncultured Sulfitobacter sp. TaxID=191468 RepID=UPI00259633BC|nr:uracil-DNA glycosylase family protein [uncultured Sulfitobacter sp.]
MNFREQIEQAYQRSGNDLGWRFLYSPSTTLAGARVAFIGLNPGGSKEDWAHAKYAVEHGSAYSRESWARNAPGDHKLQKQVLALFKRLDVEPETVLAGNLVPFRSPNWRSLRSRALSIQFGKELWAEVLSVSKPSVIVTMGTVTTKILSEMLKIDRLEKCPSGWGRVSAYRGEFEGRRLVGLPHLSRYGIMTRPESSAHMDSLFS